MGNKFVTVDLDGLAAALEERQFSAGQRQQAAAKGHAMPDGSFPIENRTDVENAVHAIGRAKDPAATKAHIKKRAKALGCTDCIPSDWMGATKESMLVGDTVDLVETDPRTLAEAKHARVKVIAPGWGTSGYYPADVLKRDASSAFPAGTHMYWDHPTVSEAGERPERSLRDLAAVTTSAGTWMESGPAGPGVYADVKVRDEYAGAVAELAPHIGVSIRAPGEVAEGAMDGRSGRIVEGIGTSHSIDFVTRAGAGGKVLQLFESARQGTKPEEGNDMELTEAITQRDQARTELSEAVALGTLAASERDTLLAENARLKEANDARTARDNALKVLGDLMVLSDFPLSEKSQARVLAETLRDPKAKDALVETMAAHAQSEIDVLVEYGLLDAGGTVRGLGASPVRDAKTDLEEAVREFVALGLTEEQAKYAATGR